MGFVYFIHNKGETSPIKIGKTSNHPSKRRSALQCGSSRTLIVHNFIECSDYTKIETILHRAFKHKKSEQGGSEWFNVDIATVDLIYSAWNKAKLLLDEPFLTKAFECALELISADEIKTLSDVNISVLTYAFSVCKKTKPPVKSKPKKVIKEVKKIKSTKTVKEVIYISSDSEDDSDSDYVLSDEEIDV
ncbi:Bacteriophage T5 orf 172 domain-containing protein [Pacmanvirus A23]|uniref:Bacteriophage T5 orf 172 domain-containing protein n=1 Tax=Pacmanvirus A23 TaxID=1932881 RepID=UPI000A091FA1|nr:Bacteriophage T5 orf 172 domain-containing protein [Pacmanvirus A23]SIP85925.1 Bacteriophage T5 orf 172 domain-containing protein [Pacmanvirus A23]